MKFKDFFMKNFIQEKVKIHSKIVKEGTDSNKIIIIKSGTFALIKKLIVDTGYYEEHKQKEKEIIMILGPNSIVGEDGFLFGTTNSYTVKSLWSDGVIYTIDSAKFAKKMNPFKRAFIELLKRRKDIIKSKIDRFIDNKVFQQKI